MRHVLGRLVGLLFLIIPLAPAWAQAEPPARVGRVSVVDGNLAFHMRGEKEWSAAGLNTPVAAGGTFWTDPKSRAEIRIGPSTLDLAADTQIDIVNLNERVAEFGLPKGRLRLHLRELGEGQSVAVDIPQGGVWLLQPGAYDITTGDNDRPTRVAVFRGNARFVGDGAEIGLKTGETALLRGANPITASLERASRDEFDDWCRVRDYAKSRLAAPYHVSPQMTGFEALDHHGSWETVAEYGEVWYPEVPAGWLPYSTGNWSWIDPWGWTWIDAEPWGFAPFHYGRWALVGGRWGWVPGTFVAQPAWAPALVAFLGAPAGGPEPTVGWFPLAPGEAYPPAAATRYANRRFATVVSERVFVAAERVAPAALHLAPEALERTPPAAAPPRVGPTAKLAGAAPAANEAPPTRAANSAALPPAPAPSAVPAPTAEQRPETSAPRPNAQAAAPPAHAAPPPRKGEAHAARTPAATPSNHAQAHASLPPAHAYRPIYVYPPPVRGYLPPAYGFEPPMHGFPPPPQMRGWPPPPRSWPPAAQLRPPPPPGFGGSQPQVAHKPAPGPSAVGDQKDGRDTRHD
jgi:hypothetical protein